MLITVLSKYADCLGRQIMTIYKVGYKALTYTEILPKQLTSTHKFLLWNMEKEG